MCQALTNTKKIRWNRGCGVILFVLLLLSACYISPPKLLPRNELFTLPLGKLDDDFDIFPIDGYKSPNKNSICMRNGTFFLANGNAKKVMELSSSGNLLSLIYHPRDIDPTLPESVSRGKQWTSKGKSILHAFQDCGSIAITRSNMLLVEDRVDTARSVYSSQWKAMLSSVVARFDKNRKYIDFLGQEGIGGTPLPYIDGIYPLSNGDISVVCRTPVCWMVYRYNAAGKRIHYVVIDNDHLPAFDDGNVRIPSLSTIRPDMNTEKLFVKIDYYPQKSEDLAEFTKSVLRVESRLYILNTLNNRYQNYFPLPFEQEEFPNARNYEVNSVQSLHTFLGATTKGTLYFLNHFKSEKYMLTIIDQSGRVRQKRILDIDDSKIYDRAFSLSPEGILSALLGYENNVAVVWWRSDR